jgi:eukaryotic-like serine/threonine-protein kinase
MTEELRQGGKLGNNELVLRVGRGGMATVWVARERASGKVERLVAVKAMLLELADDPEFVKMFRDEVRLVRSIRHPNVVEVHDVGEEAGVMWMSMEWVEGESLHTVIAEAGKRRAIPPEMAVRIIADVSAGLHAAHELRDERGQLQGVVHRDISPHNILIGTNGSIKLVDFGVAKAVGRASEATRVGQLKGKFGYMSPEQARGQPVDRRSDVFSLGIVLFELTTGRRLFRGETDLQTLELVTKGQLPPPTAIDPAYPPELEKIVLTALERDPSKRYATAADLERDLRGFLKSKRMVVAASGIAALLKRVVGDRIEQRRLAVRAALKALGTEGKAGDSLLPGDRVFTPTGERSSRESSSAVSGAKLSGPGRPLAAPARLPAFPNRPAPSSAKPVYAGAPSGTLGYAIGLAGITIAILVLLLFQR